MLKHTTKKPFPTRIPAVLLGTVSMTAQIILVREFMAVFYGNELSIGFLLFSWLFWVSAGSGTGNYILKSAGFVTFRVLNIITLACILSGMVTVKFVRPLLTVPYGEFVTFLQLMLFSLLVLALPCFCIGLLYALLARQCARKKENRGDPSAVIYIFESLGSTAAGVLLSLLLLRWFDHSVIFLLLGTGVFLVFAVFTRRPVYFIAVAALLLLIVPAPGIEFKLLKQYWQSVGPGFELLHARQTKFGRMSVIDWAGQKYVYRNGQKSTALPDDISAQATAALVMCAHPSPAKTLLLGGGLSGLAPEMARYSLTSLRYRHLDREAFETAFLYLDAKDQNKWDNPNLKTVFGDGRSFLQHTDEKFDLIALDTGRPSTATGNRYYTAEFFRLVHSRLEENGVLVLCHVPSAENFLSREMLAYNASIYATLKTAFPAVLAVPGDHAYFIAARTKDALPTRAEDFYRHFERHKMTPDFFHPGMFYAALDSARMTSFRKKLDDYPDPRINRDFKPVCYFFDFLLWNKLVRGQSDIIWQLNRLKFRHIFIIQAAVILLWAGFTFSARRSTKVKSAALLTVIAIVGFSGMALNVILILAFQTLFGYVYEWIGIALGLFMAGMTAGSRLVNRRLHLLSHTGTLTWVLSILAGTSLLLVPVFLFFYQLSVPGLFLILIFWCGGLIGAAFPPACTLYGALQKKHKPGSIYSADVLGGAIGTLVCGGLMVPLLGFFHTLAVVALACLGAGLVVWMVK